LRCYQLSHPEEATEGMNRVAQAFICLTEALAQGSRVSKEANGAGTAHTLAASVDTQQLQGPGARTSVDWKTTPPPVRVVTDFGNAHEATLSPSLDQAAVANAPPPPSPPQPYKPVPVDPIVELAQSPEARRGLGTLPALIERIHQTRRLILA